MGLVFIGLGLAQAGLAEQVDGRQAAAVPEGPEPSQGVAGSLADDEAPGELGDVLLHLVGRPAGEHPGGLQPLKPPGEESRNLDLGAAQVLLEVSDDLGGAREARKGVDEAEEGDLCGLVGHRPIKELAAPPIGAEQG